MIRATPSPGASPLPRVTFLYSYIPRIKQSKPAVRYTIVASTGRSTLADRAFPVAWNADNRARQLYNNISMLFLFPVKDGKLSTGVIAIFNASCYTVSLQQSKITLQNNCINNTSITQPTLSFYF